MLLRLDLGFFLSQRTVFKSLQYTLDTFLWLDCLQEIAFKYQECTIVVQASNTDMRFVTVFIIF